MTINPAADLTPSPPPPPPPSAVCGNCGADEGRLLHHVRHRGLFRRLCTTCVLRLHPQSYCPSCFSLFPLPSLSSSSSAVTTVSCSKCYSSTHPHCLLGPATTSPYVCPPCRNPSSPIFNPTLVRSLDSPTGVVKMVDRNSARVLLAAAKIASLSMGKAAVAARAEAEKRAEEAARTRKRARDALEHVAYLVGREKPKRKESGMDMVAVGASGNGVDGPSEVSARLNAVGLKEREREVVVQMGGQSNGVQHSQEKVGNEVVIDL